MEPDPGEHRDTAVVVGEAAAQPARARWDEERRRNLILASLPWRHYQLAVEPGCGDGLVTSALADRCDRVLAWDVDPTAVLTCRAAVAVHGNVEVRRGQLPTDWPADIADLVVLSDIGYYLTGAELDTVIARAVVGLAPGGTLLAAHLRQPGPAFGLGGDDVHAHLFGRPGLHRIGGYADDELRIDIFQAEWSPPV